MNRSMQRSCDRMQKKIKDNLMAKVVSVSIVCFLLSLAPCCALDLSEAVVAVYGIQNDNKTSQGTGFFISNDGQILTAYHVVMQAREIMIVQNDQIYTEVLCESISPEYDLAILKVERIRFPVPYLRLADDDYFGSGEEQVSVIAWPRGLPTSKFNGRLIQSNLLDGQTIQNTDGSRIFAKKIKLLMLDLTTYNGMSGGPVIINGQVVGVLSGSYGEGGAIAWAIPIGYCKFLQAFGKHPYEIQSWPPFMLLQGTWNELRSWYTFNVAEKKAYEGLYSQLKKTIANNQEVKRYASIYLKAASNDRVSRKILLDSLADKNRFTVKKMLKHSKSIRKNYSHLLEARGTGYQYLSKLISQHQELYDILNRRSGFEKSISDPTLRVKIMEHNEIAKSLALQARELLHRENSQYYEISSLLEVTISLLDEAIRFPIGSDQYKTAVVKWLENHNKLVALIEFQWEQNRSGSPTELAIRFLEEVVYIYELKIFN